MQFQASSCIIRVMIFTMETRVYLLVFLALGCSNSAQAKLESKQGFILTGPKSILVGSLEKFCVTVKHSAHSVAKCTLDLIVDKSVVASVHHQLNGM